MKKKSPALLLTIIGFVGVFIIMFSSPDKPSYNPTVTSHDTQNTIQQQETTTPEVDRLPNMPEKYYSHVFLDARKNGGCDTLEGTIKPIIIFVDDADYQWSEEEIENYKKLCNEALDVIRQDAAEYEITLTIEAEYLTSTTEGEFVRGAKNDWTDIALKNANLPYGNAVNDALEILYDVDEVPLILCTNQSGRATASFNGSTEFIHQFQDATSLRHEIYHLFGAKDLYYPEEVQNLANTMFPNSIMMQNEGSVVDNLTAYLIGFTDTPSEETKEFLEKTNHITAADMDAAQKEETYTGYVTDRKTSNGTYTGYIKDGFFEGEGTLTFADGSSYTGEWKNGKRNGNGTYYFSNGDVFTGQWKDNNRNGYGTYYFSNGDVYTGEWKDSNRNGYGTYTFADGSTQSGIWQNDKYIG